MRRKEIGCLSGSLIRIGERLTGNVMRLGEDLSGSLIRIGEGLNGYVSLICTSNRSCYLNVVPNVVWLSPDELASVDFDIISNVKWVIN